MSYGEISNGLEDVVVARNTAGVPGTAVDFPGAQSLNYSVNSDSNQVKGDDIVQATVRSAKTLEGSITVAKINLLAMSTVVGGTPTTLGTGSAHTITLNESDQAPSLFFTLGALTKAYDSTGAGYAVILKNLTITSGADETLAVDEFNTPTLDFEGTGISGVLMTRQNQETKAATAVVTFP